MILWVCRSAQAQLLATLIDNWLTDRTRVFLEVGKVWIVCGMFCREFSSGLKLVLLLLRVIGVVVECLGICSRVKFCVGILIGSKVLLRMHYLVVVMRKCCRAGLVWIVVMLLMLVVTLATIVCMLTLIITLVTILVTLICMAIVVVVVSC